ncbi:MAG TPA: hypothetical protein VFD15_03275 [Clostridia bacterium]|nr:hypothetical protein [Clostridia bacterium]
MERFKRFINATVNLEKVRDVSGVKAFEVECTYLPDPVEDFDEFEFKTEYGGKTIIIGFAVEMGKIKRLMFVEPDADNPDIVKALTPEELDNFFKEKFEQMTRFYEFITD